MLPLRFFLSVPLLLYTASALAQLTPEQKDANLRSFEIVWQTVRDHHPDPALDRADWRKAHDETKPLIEKSRNMNEVRAALRSMLARLRTSHYAIIPAYEYAPGEDTAAKGPRSREATPGFETIVIDGKAVVKSVEPGSPAERAGIRPGQVISGINGEKVAPLIDAMRSLDTPEASALAERSIARKLLGPNKSAVGLEVVDGGGGTRRIEIERAEPPGDAVSFANLPPVRVVFGSRLLESGAGYILLNVFLDPAKVMPEFESALNRFRSAPGVILDLRGNPGGMGVMAMGIAGFFVDRSGLTLGEMKNRDITLKFAVFPRPHPYLGKVAILVDQGSASTSEILAQGLRDIAHARIFGTQTAGAALPSDIIRLPNGDGFQYAEASYVSKNGRVLEGNGVMPDVEVRETAADIEAGRDHAMEAAETWIGGR